MVSKLTIFIFIATTVTGCGTKQTTSTRKTYPNAPTSTANKKTHNTNQSELEKEYQNLTRTYKAETADVLNSLLNGSSADRNVSISVENQSNCNMVLTIKSRDFIKKIPIAAHKTGVAMIPKNQNYQLTAMICNANYERMLFIKKSAILKVSN